MASRRSRQGTKRPVAGQSPERKGDGRPPSSRGKGFGLSETEGLPMGRAILDTVLDALPNPVFVKDEAHRWILFNSAFCRFLGHGREELLGKSDYDFFPKEEADVFWAKDREVFATNEAVANEEALTDHSGTTRWILTRKSCFDLPDGRRVLVGVITDISDRKQSEALRAQFVERVVAVQEEERRRIARELQDVTGQTLTSLLVGLRSLEESSSLSAAQETSRSLRRLGASSLEALSRLASGLHPAALDDLGLAAAIRSYVTRLADAHCLKLSLNLAENTAALSHTTQLALYRIMQEAVGNVVEHAQASAVSIVLYRHGSRFRLVVADDGIGFDPTALVGTSSTLGLVSINERAALIGARVSIDSSPGSGTTLVVDVPLKGRNAPPGPP